MVVFIGLCAAKIAIKWQLGKKTFQKLRLRVSRRRFSRARGRGFFAVRYVSLPGALYAGGLAELSFKGLDP